MDKLDTEILNEIQWKFPLIAKPFDEIAKKFKISSDEISNFFAISSNGLATNGNFHCISFKISVSSLSISVNIPDLWPQLKNVTSFLESINTIHGAPEC